MMTPSYSRILLVSLTGMTLVLGGCFGTSRPTETGVSDNLDTSLPAPTLEQCQAAVQDYLATLTPDADMTSTIESGMTVVVDYVGRLADGSVFDTSVEGVAQGCGLFVAERDYTTGLEFVAGAGQMIPGFDQGVIGMAVGQTKTITIPADQAYGGSTITVPVEEFPLKEDGTAYQAGESVMTMNGSLLILERSDTEVTIENKHPLANQDLIFDITVKNINP